MNIRQGHMHNYTEDELLKFAEFGSATQAKLARLELMHRAVDYFSGWPESSGDVQSDTGTYEAGYDEGYDQGREDATRELEQRFYAILTSVFDKGRRHGKENSTDPAGIHDGPNHRSIEGGRLADTGSRDRDRQ